MDDLSNKKIIQLREICLKLGSKPPSNLSKDELIKHIRELQLKQGNKESIAVNINNRPELPFEAKYMRDIDWKTHLGTYGWAVVPIPNFPTQKYVDAFWTWMESCRGGIQRDNPKTCIDENLPVRINGIFRHYIGHTQWIWEIREHCYPIFNQLWNSENLLCSFDGGCFLPPSNQSERQWFHVDQGRMCTDLCCVQGLVNLYPSGPNDGGLLVIEKSHTVFAEYYQRHQNEGIEPRLADVTDPGLSKLEVIKVCAGLGELILWDSRVFHCNTNPRGKIPRMCTYVSMQPRSQVSEKHLQKRIQIYQSGRMTGHWCYGPWFIENSKYPQVYGANDIQPPQIEIANLNPLQRKLVGF